MFNDVNLFLKLTNKKSSSDVIGNPDDPINSVYAYVPVEIVNKMLEKHGGIIDIFA